MSLQNYLVISIILFSLGIFCVLTRRNAISILMGIELILNSCNLNFAAFSRFVTPPDDISEKAAWTIFFTVTTITADPTVSRAKR